MSITVQVTVGTNGSDWGGIALDDKELKRKQRVEEELLELRYFLNEFLKNHIQELQYALLCSKYHMDYSLDGILTGGLSAATVTCETTATSATITGSVNSGKAKSSMVPSNKSPVKTGTRYFEVQ